MGFHAFLTLPVMNLTPSAACRPSSTRSNHAEEEPGSVRWHDSGGVVYATQERCLRALTL